MRTVNASTQRSASNAVIEFSINKVSLDLEDLPPELSVDDLIRLSMKKEFPKKNLIVNNKIKKYTPALHFFDSTRIFKKHPKTEDKFEYKCKICSDILVSPFTDKSNLTKHLKYNDEFLIWNESFCLANYKQVGPSLDEATMLLIKYFITSNTRHSNLENECLRALINKALGTKTFDDSKLPEIYKQ
jgi:hypothetical protein